MLRALMLLAACAAAAGARRGTSRDASNAAADLPPQASPLFGEAGELWKSDGPLPDFSFAGYRFGGAELPSPPVTRQLSEFQGPDVNDSQALQAAVDWANAQPESAGKLGLSFMPACLLYALQKLQECIKSSLSTKKAACTACRRMGGAGPAGG